MSHCAGSQVAQEEFKHRTGQMREWQPQNLRACSTDEFML
jgi:hypothetical protein